MNLKKQKNISKSNDNYEDLNDEEKLHLFIIEHTKWKNFFEIIRRPYVFIAICFLVGIIDLLALLYFAFCLSSYFK